MNTLNSAFTTLTLFGLSHFALAPAHAAPVADGTMATATLVDANGKTLGNIAFQQDDDEVEVKGQLTDLPANSKHGLHVHEGKSCDGPSFASAGEHFNPKHKSHGGTDGKDRHPGDLGNVKSNDSGMAKVDLEVKAMLGTSKESLVGHTLILHAKEDDTKSQPAGKAGDRIACAVIQGK